MDRTSEHWLISRFDEHGDGPAMVWRHTEVTYRDLAARVRAWRGRLVDLGVVPGQVVAVRGDYSPESAALLVALIEAAAVAVPMSPTADHLRLHDIAEVELSIALRDDDTWEAAKHPRSTRHPLRAGLDHRRSPGLVLFSSGSTGEPKASLLDFERLIARYREPRKARRTLAFLLLDHIGGLNTLFYILAGGGTAVSISSRQPRAVAAAIQAHGVELLPTSPTFLTMLLMSGAHTDHDLSSLQLVTYGTEPMPAATLQRLNAELPWVQFKQTYGLSELGILPTRSVSSDSLWLKLGGSGFDVDIRDGILWIRSDSAMLGYLNAPDPFDTDGWFNTGDEVEVEGDRVRILGRRSEIINVGGQKVYPAEVEGVLEQIDNVAQAVVRGRRNPVTGSVVVATLTLISPEDPGRLQQRVRAFCALRLEPHQVPVVVLAAETLAHGERFKKMRRVAGS